MIKPEAGAGTNVGAGIIARCAALASRLTLTRYLAASILSLCVDMGLFLALSTAGMIAGWAAILGYGAGILVHWLLSVRFVFTGMAAIRPGQGQCVQFLLSALLGLAITGLTVSMLTMAGMTAPVAKGISVIISFTAVYLVRKHVVFADR